MLQISLITLFFLMQRKMSSNSLLESSQKKLYSPIFLDYLHWGLDFYLLRHLTFREVGYMFRKFSCWPSSQWVSTILSFLVENLYLNTCLGSLSSVVRSNCNVHYLCSALLYDIREIPSAVRIQAFLSCNPCSVCSHTSRHFVCLYVYLLLSSDSSPHILTYITLVPLLYSKF